MFRAAPARTPAVMPWAAERAHRGAFVVLAVLLAWAPMPLGSNRGWSAGLLAAGFLAIGFWLCLNRLWRRHGDLPWPPGSTWVFSLLAAGALYALLQIVPLPVALVEALSPQAAQAWRNAGSGHLATLSLDRGASAAVAVQAAGLAALFAAVCVTARTRRRVRLLCLVMVTLGVAEALLGIAAELARAQGWVPSGPLHGVGGASGTFVNPNHFAGFLEVALCLGVGLLLTGGLPGEALPDSARELLSRLVAFTLTGRAVLVTSLLLMLVAVLWSGSRGALLALGVSLPAVFVAALPPLAGTSARARFTGLAAVIVVLALSAAWAGAGALSAKLERGGTPANRVALARATLAMAADHPLTGSGAGTFGSVFPAYKGEALGHAAYRHAHNDGLQRLAEGGILGAALSGGAIAIGLAVALRRARRRRSRTARALTGGAVAACVSLLVHGLYDFNLQIPANASAFVLALALALAAASLPRPGDREPRA